MPMLFVQEELYRKVRTTKNIGKNNALARLLQVLQHYTSTIDVNTDAMPWPVKTKHLYILREQTENFLFMGYYCIEAKILTFFY